MKIAFGGHHILSHIYICIEVPPHLRHELFIQKIRQCTVICNFSDPGAELAEKEIKRHTLQEILGYVSMNRGVLTSEAVYPEIIKLVFKYNLYYDYFYLLY